MSNFKQILPRIKNRYILNMILLCVAVCLLSTTVFMFFRLQTISQEAKAFHRERTINQEQVLNTKKTMLKALLSPIDMSIYIPENSSGSHNSTVSANAIPKIIWTFWDSGVFDIPNEIAYCIATWKLTNPDYIVNIIGKDNLPKEFQHIYNMKFMSHAADSQPPRLSDMIRLHVIAKYGGIWLDASTILNTDLGWVHRRQERGNADFIGFYVSRWTRMPASPVIESWFLAAPPGSPFVNDWLAEFLKINDYPTVEDYANAVSHKYNLQDIPWVSYGYFSIHLAVQVLQQTRKPYNIDLRKAEDGPLKCLATHDWNSENAMKALENGKCVSELIKLTKNERFFFKESSFANFVIAFALKIDNKKTVGTRLN